MSFDSMSAVLIAIAFLVPGFILSSVLAMTFRRRSKAPSELLLQYLTLSCINHGFWSWLLVIMVSGQWLHKYPIRTAFVIFLVVFVSPVVFGLIAKSLSRNDSIKSGLAAIGFMVYRFIPTAWDHKFEEERPSWVIVRLKDGSVVYGFFGNFSFAGDDPEERDLYIEAVFRQGDSAQWQPVADTEGILIKADEISTIEFRRIEGQEEHTQ